VAAKAEGVDEYYSSKKESNNLVNMIQASTQKAVEVTEELKIFVDDIAILPTSDDQKNISEKYNVTM